MCKVNAKLKSNKIYEKKMETVLTRAKLYNLQEYRIDKKGEKKNRDYIIFRNVHIRKAYPQIDYCSLVNLNC